MKYFQNILTTIKNHNLIFFTIIIFLLQIISNLLKPYSINLYGPAHILSLYGFINSPLSIYQLIMAGIVSTSVSYVIYKIFTKITPQINIPLLNVVTVLFVLTGMTIFNCVSMAALAYTLMSYVSIPQNTISYLYSYILATIIIVILCSGVLFIIKNIDKNFIDSDLSNLQQLEKNMKL